MTEGEVRRSRWRRAAAGSVLAVLAAGCSSSSSGGSGAGAGPSASATPTSGPQAVAFARAAMRSVTSYAFRLTVTQTGAHATTLSATGVVQGTDRMTGAFLVGGRTVRVLTAPAGDWVKLPGTPWRRDPHLSLHALPWDQVLAGAGDASLAPGTGGARWRVTAHPSSSLAGVLALTSTPGLKIKDLTLTFDLDDGNRVTRLDAVASGTDGGQAATLHETVLATGFDEQRPVPDRPAGAPSSSA